EHSDRAARLKRLSERDLIAPPGFNEYIIGQDLHRLHNFPAAIPVLRVVFDNRVFFDVDRSDIRPEAQHVLDVVAEAFGAGDIPDVAMFVAGHTDSTGSDDYNYNVGLRRAQAVAEWLVRRGVGQAEIYRVSFGERVPIASN